MSAFLKPTSLSAAGLDFGSNTYLPQFRGFGPQPTPEDLATEINTWTLLQLAVPSISTIIASVQYEHHPSLGPGPEASEYTALVHYDLVELT